MSGEEDEKEYELKDLIVQTLEANGVLPKIKVNINKFTIVEIPKIKINQHDDFKGSNSSERVYGTRSKRQKESLGN